MPGRSTFLYSSSAVPMSTGTVTSEGNERLQGASHGSQVHPYEVTESDHGYVGEIDRVRTRAEVKQNRVPIGCGEGGHRETLAPQSVPGRPASRGGRRR